MATARSGLKVAIDASELAAFSKRCAQVAKVATPTMAVGLNEVGDGLVSLMASRLSKDTGLSLEQVRGLVKVERASPGSLEYEVVIARSLLDDKLKGLEGDRPENKDFGERQPGTLVIVVSKKDGLVCADCAALESAGPMPVETAKAHLPVHPHCRCVIMPYVQPRRRLPVTMTSLTGTSPQRRAGVKPLAFDQDVTLRQLAQNILNRTAGRIKIALS